MEPFNRQVHWENIYTTKALNEVSWYQPIPKTSLDFIASFNLPHDAKIIDVGGGDSFLVDHLLELGYTHISVLDVSQKAIERAKERLGKKAELVRWIVADASQFTPEQNYDVWHDRAAFHFLTSETEVSNYVNTASAHISSNGKLIIGTFSENGPLKCSGIEIRQYSQNQLKSTFDSFFDAVECKNIDHQTPSGGIQNFNFCVFSRK